jgi:phage shock protein C
MSSETKRLTRSVENRMLAGVCGGLGEYLGIDPTLVRLAFALFFIAGFGSSALLYLLMWLIVPEEGKADATPKETMEASMKEIKEKTRSVGEGISQRISPKSTEQSKGDESPPGNPSS